MGIFNLRWIRTFLGLGLFLLSPLASADIPLLFPAEQNKIQVLPQRFEYTLLDSERIKIGDILIDATLLRFEILKSESEKVQLMFSWPAGLLQEGGISLINNNGRAIWDSPILKKDIKIAKVENKESPELRSDLAQLTSQPIDPELFENMKYYPFMKFCVTQIKGDTRIELCSKELYLSTKEGKLIIKSRSANEKKAVVTINGKAVGEQGLIFLNDRSQNISFRAEAVSGATLDVETRRKDVEFMDVTIGKDPQTLVFEARGAEPVTESTVTRLTNGNWRSVLPLERPVLYLQGEGGIPLRQEFFVRGSPPKTESRPFLAPTSLNKTYQSDLSLLGSTPNGTRISNLPKDPPTLSQVAPNRFRWNLGPMKAGNSHRQLAQITTNEGTWIAGYDVYRGYSIEGAARFSVLAPWNLSLGSLELHYWFERFLGLSSPFFLQRWSLGASQESSFTKKAESIAYGLTQVELRSRLNSGINYRDPGGGIAIKMSSLSLATSTLSTVGVGYFYRGPLMDWAAEQFPWTTLTLDYLLPAKSTDLEFKGMLRGRLLLEKPLGGRTYFDLGLSIENWTAWENSTLEPLQMGLNIGLRGLY